MCVVCSAFTIGMAVVLLGTACSGQPRGGVKELVSDHPVFKAETVALARPLGSLGDRSSMETLRTLLFRGEPEDVRAEAAIAVANGEMTPSCRCR